MAKWLSVPLRTKWFWVRVQLQPNKPSLRILKIMTSKIIIILLDTVLIKQKTATLLLLQLLNDLGTPLNQKNK